MGAIGEWRRQVPQPGNSNPHIGSSFDDFLDDDGIAAEVTGQAVREIIARLVIDHMAESGLTKTERRPGCTPVVRRSLVCLTRRVGADARYAGTRGERRGQEGADFVR
jgi:hypothetical protein